MGLALCSFSGGKGGKKSIWILLGFEVEFRLKKPCLSPAGRDANTVLWFIISLEREGSIHSPGCEDKCLRVIGVQNTAGSSGLCWCYYFKWWPLISLRLWHWLSKMTTCTRVRCVYSPLPPPSRCKTSDNTKFPWNHSSALLVNKSQTRCKLTIFSPGYYNRVI